MIYPYGFIYNRKKKVLLWESSGDGLDKFRLDESGNLISAPAKKELKKSLNVKYLDEVEWQVKTYTLNLDKFWNRLKRLKKDKALTKSTCIVLIDGWNFLNDLSRTFDIKDNQSSFEHGVIDKVYEKLFYGNNLPSVTPKNYEYNPIFLSDELKEYKKFMKHTWDRLRDRIL